MSEIILSAPLRDAMALYQRWEQRDPEALAEVAQMFPVGCFACGAACGENPGLLSLEDPRRVGVSAILAPLCAGCMSLPLLYRSHRIDKMVRAMFGARSRWIKPNELRKYATAGPP